VCSRLPFPTISLRRSVFRKGTDWNLQRLIADVSMRAPTGKPAAGASTKTRARAHTSLQQRSPTMTLGTILVIVLILVLIGAIPNWGYSRGWGYGPSGIVGVVLVVVLVLLLMGRI
jgi:hypothetical protein